SWRWIFYVNLPIGIVAAVLMIMSYRESRGEKRPIDFAGALTVTGGIVLFLLATARGGEAWAWTSWQSISMYGAAVALLVIFGIIETRVPEPVLDPALFHNRTFSVVSIVGFLMGAGMFGAIMFVPYFIQGVVGVDPNQAGNVMTPMMLTMVVFSILSGRLALKLQYRVQISVGFAVVATAFYLMTHWNVDTTQLQATLSSMVLGAGLGLIMPILMLSVQNAFPANRRGVVTSASTFFRQIGATVGITVFGVIFNNQMASRFQTDLAPAMAKMGPTVASLPPQAQQFFQQIKETPQVLIRMLLSPEAQQMVPPAVRDQFIGGSKLMMAQSLQVVFWTGMGVVLVGLLVTQLIGNASLKRQAAEHGEDVHIDTIMTD
ncbi:MAG: drug resistance transporter, EmrB/QacA subfamily, partial [Firmicutes bacterium]|nr:drug resistance transporter, EmrB/QacA subfamily [Bacillota bacterium]